MPGTTVVLVTREGLGHVAADDKEFGREMFDRFLHALETQPVKPRTMCFYTEAVKLLCRGSPVVPGLRLVAGMGVRLIACKTCLDHYGLLGEVAVGEVVGMNEIVAEMNGADHVVSV